MPQLTIQHVPESNPPQFRLRRERDGTWTVVIEKEAASSNLLRSVVQKYLGFDKG